MGSRTCADKWPKYFIWKDYTKTIVFDRGQRPAVKSVYMLKSRGQRRSTAVNRGQLLFFLKSDFLYKFICCLPTDSVLKLKDLSRALNTCCSCLCRTDGKFGNPFRPVKKFLGSFQLLFYLSHSCGGSWGGRGSFFNEFQSKMMIFHGRPNNNIKTRK